MPPTVGFGRGLAAGCAFVTLELAARVFGGVLTLPELIQDRLVQMLPGPLFAWVLTHLLYLGKPTLFSTLLLFQILLGGLAGTAIAAIRRPVELVAGLWLFTGFGLLPLAERDPFDGSLAILITTLVAFVAYVAALELFSHPEFQLTKASAAQSAPPLAGAKVFGRRELVGGLALFVVSAAMARKAIGTLPGLPSRGAALPPPVTSPEDFYVVSKNIIDPEVNAKRWSLQVDGLVDHSLKLSYDDILALPSWEFVRTMECISNEVGGDLISTGQFTGVRMSDLLSKAGVHADAQLLHFTSVDDYTENMPIAKAMHPDTFLVYKLGGQPLPQKHGYPVRVLGAGTYGMKNPKWLKRIELVARADEGFWEHQGWTNEGIIQTISRIDIPGDGSTAAAGDFDIEGIAFAGDRGIKAVEVSTDGGKSWQAAALTPPQGPLTWVFWRRVFTLQPGNYALKVRATDGSGQLQTERQTDSYPDGATGYHSKHTQVHPTRSVDNP
jgi:DMSO/TMAO reductase YedYZ molybdopterin-dependent catalytic subunit